eukprot:CAMPEP_0119266078 /NCGR_PEP_ID=MMETSP1329-20130426/4692_1 /TAXON_ID=114041 /ORGANISM="Genus nov. species nov., Strain RCC1024" /LENGTH=178 /DNA_ID=CAMNT_0007265941 /DNA_START=35 /DNA_END=568 /DNA_ORIENTATION=+
MSLRLSLLLLASLARPTGGAGGENEQRQLDFNGHEVAENGEEVAAPSPWPKDTGGVENFNGHEVDGTGEEVSAPSPWPNPDDGGVSNFNGHEVGEDGQEVAAPSPWPKESDEDDETPAPAPVKRHKKEPPALAAHEAKLRASGPPKFAKTPDQLRAEIAELEEQLRRADAEALRAEED